MCQRKWMDYKEPRLTIGYTYYEDPKLLKEQIFLWEKYPPEIEIIVIDDGSVNYPAFDLLKDLDIKPNLRLYSVDEDLGFNSHGCRNLIANIAFSKNVLFCDLDCQFSPNDIALLRTIQFDSNRFYTFASYSTSSYRYNKKGHVNVFLVDTDTFWLAGGYDESFTGWHTGDREFLDRLRGVADERKLGIACTIVRGKREVIVDNSVNKTVYDNDRHTLTTPERPVRFAEMIGTVTTKINFSYTELL